MFLPPTEVLDFFPDYRTTQIAWQGLAPVAAWAIWSLKPRRVVELGSYRGDSFFAFLEAASQVPELDDLVAVDSWAGDQHTGPFTEQVYAQFHAELERRSDHRARSIRALFADAASQFENGSIDLLHIDGAHDYDAVKLDFEQWLPKMSPGGVVLFHDTVVTDSDFGVWKLWKELEAAYPKRTFNFEHSNGLGVLFLGDDETGDFRKLAGLPLGEASILRDAMRLAGEAIVNSTRYEYLLATRNGGRVDLDHIYSRGHERAKLERLRSIESVNYEFRDLEVSVERWFNEHKNDLVAALVEPSLGEFGKLLKGEMDGQLRHALDNLSAKLEEFLLRSQVEREELERTLEKLVAKQRESLQQSRIKENAQDDAIMAIDQKIEAQDQAISIILGHLRHYDPRFTS